VPETQNFYSQFKTESLVAELLKRVGVKHQVCCELGAWDGIKFSNIAHLVRHQGWSGVFVEGNEERAIQCKMNYADYPQATVIHAWVTSDNVDDLVPKDCDFLSVDIDGNDYWVFKSLSHRPRLIEIEYNHRKKGVEPYPYDPHFNFRKQGIDKRHVQAGAAAFILLAESLDYYFLTSDGQCNLFFAPEEVVCPRDHFWGRPTIAASDK
jgi:hypothetical protein